MNPPEGGFLLEIRMAKAKGNSYVGSAVIEAVGK